MEVYKMGMVPGPSKVDEKIAANYLINFGSPDLETEFMQLYSACECDMQALLCTKNQIAIQSGEGMLALWGALKSVFDDKKPEKLRLLAVASGVFGDGFADMAKTIGYDTCSVSTDYDSVVNPEEVRKKAKIYKPDIITVVHCETPSGTLVPSEFMEEYGKIAQDLGALFCVDFVSSAAGAEVLVDKWGIDMGILGSQKCLSLPPDLCFTSVSDKAWAAAEKAAYSGYDALLPFKDVALKGEFPYTHNWRALKALKTSLEMFFEEGASNVYKRHSEAAQFCRDGLKNMGYKLFAKEETLSSPTVTAAYVPNGTTWREFDKKLRDRGVVLAGSYGCLQNKVFRIGHMGTQANIISLKEILEIMSINPK